MNYTSQNTNPLFERESAGITDSLLPLRVVYDHQYGRWYLIGYHSRTGIKKLRMDGLTQVEEGEPVEEEEFAQRLQQLGAQLEYSWVTDTNRTVKVAVRFYNPSRSGANFIRERVEAQGQWGTITEESDTTFLYEIMVNEIFEIKPWLRSFGSSCEILSPAGCASSSWRNGRRLRATMNPFEKIFNFQIISRLEEAGSLALTSQERSWLRTMLGHPAAAEAFSMETLRKLNFLLEAEASIEVREIIIEKARSKERQVYHPLLRPCAASSWRIREFRSRMRSSMAGNGPIRPASLTSWSTICISGSGICSGTAPGSAHSCPPSCGTSCLPNLLPSPPTG